MLPKMIGAYKTLIVSCRLLLKEMTLCRRNQGIGLLQEVDCHCVLLGVGDLELDDTLL